MRLRTMAILVSMVATGTSAWAEVPAAAEKAAAPAATAPVWDDSHMRSRYQETPRVNRPLITGESGYSALANGSSESNSEVTEQLEYTSQRQWTQGSLSTSSGSSQSAGSAEQNREAGGVHRGGRSGAPGSQLRRGSVHRGRH